MSSTTAMLRGIWATVTNDRITPARNAVTIFASVANRAVFPLSMDHPDTQVAVEFFSDSKNIDALMNSIFGPLCGMNSDSTYGFLPWIVLADQDEKLREAVLNLLGPESSIGRICSELSTPSPNFFQNLRKNWGDEFGAVLAQSESEADGVVGADGSNDRNQPVFITQPIPLSMICYFSTRVLHETTSSNLRTKSRLDIPPVMLLPIWTPPIVTQKFSATMSTDASGAAAAAGGHGGGSGGFGGSADLTVSSLRVSMLSYILFRMIRCLVSFGQVRDKQSYIASYVGRKLGPVVRRAIAKLPPTAAAVTRAIVHFLSVRSSSNEHRFATLEQLILNWSQHLLSASIGRSMLHREKVLELLVTGSTPADDARLLNLCDPNEWHASVLTLLLPTMCHIYGTPMNGEAARNPLTDQRHIDLIECTLPLLTQFLGQLSTSLDVASASAASNSNTGGNSSNSNNNSRWGNNIMNTASATSQQNINSNNSNATISIDPQVKAAIEKTPRLTVHDVSVPARSALRVCTGVARQTMMTLFVTKRESVEDSESLLFDRVCELWVAIVRCARSLARFTDPLNVGLRQYEATCALLGDFIELSMRAEAEWGTKLAASPAAHHLPQIHNHGSDDTSTVIDALLNSNVNMMRLTSIENFALILSWLIDYSSSSSSSLLSSSSSPIAGSPSDSANRGQPHSFVKECSSALEQLQVSGGNAGAASAVAPAPLQQSSAKSITTAARSSITSALALADALDASMNVNALFDFQGEAPAGESVPSWRCFMALLGRNSRISMSRLYQILRRTLDSYSEIASLCPPAASPTLAGSPTGNRANEIAARVTGVRKQLDSVFLSLYGEDFIFNSCSADADALVDGASSINGVAAGGDEDLQSIFSASRFRQQHDQKNHQQESTSSSSSSASTSFMNKKKYQNLRFTYDPNVSVLTRSSARLFNNGKCGLSEIDCNTCDELRYKNADGSNGGPHRFVPSIDEVHCLARIFHQADVVFSAILFFVLSLVSRFLLPLLTGLFEVVVVNNIKNKQVRSGLKSVLETMKASTLSSSSTRLPSCCYCNHKLELATDSYCCHIHDTEIGVWHCNRCNVSYCAPACRFVPTTTAATAASSYEHGKEGEKQQEQQEQQYLPIVPATNRVKEVTVCAKCLIKMNPSDTQYWVQASRSILCPRCVLGGSSWSSSFVGDWMNGHITLFRYLASNYLIVAVVSYYVLTFLWWLFFGDEPSSQSSPYYYGGGSNKGEFMPQYSPKMMFVEDFNTA